MPTCVICLNALRNPAALPCGHVFCYDCIIRVVRNTQPFTQQHYCAMCRAPYVISSIDQALIPLHLRPHLTPAIRKLSLDYSVTSTPAGTTPVSEYDRLRSENASLRSCCEVWRKRAAVHAAASLGLVGLARLTRDEVLKMKKEKTDLEKKYDALVRDTKAQHEQAEHHISPNPNRAMKGYLMTPPGSSESPQRTRRRSFATASSSRSASPCDSEGSCCSGCSSCGPAAKRRRLSTPRTEFSPVNTLCEVKQSPRTPTLPPTPRPEPITA